MRQPVGSQASSNEDRGSNRSVDLTAHSPTQLPQNWALILKISSNTSSLLCAFIDRNLTIFCDPHTAPAPRQQDHPHAQRSHARRRATSAPSHTARRACCKNPGKSNEKCNSSAQARDQTPQSCARRIVVRAHRLASADAARRDADARAPNFFCTIGGGCAAPTDHARRRARRARRPDLPPPRGTHPHAASFLAAARRRSPGAARTQGPMCATIPQNSPGFPANRTYRRPRNRAVVRAHPWRLWALRRPCVRAAARQRRRTAGGLNRPAAGPPAPAACTAGSRGRCARRPAGSRRLPPTPTPHTAHPATRGRSGDSRSAPSPAPTGFGR